jgi:hypothetical protein
MLNGITVRVSISLEITLISGNFTSLSKFKISKRLLVLFVADEALDLFNELV